jgi:mannose-6-phosphate isomerase-like protein (cupin superfamily)
MQEARIEETPEGQVPADGGWFILNLGEMAWEAAQGFGAWLDFDHPDTEPSARVGVHVHVLQPGETNGLYHAEAAQEGFLVLSGECIAVVESEERRMRQWDYFHSPPGTEHITVGAGDEPCAILMFGSPDPRRKVEWIANETAAKYGASVAKTTGRDTEAYGDLPPLERVRSPKPFGR